LGRRGEGVGEGGRKRARRCNPNTATCVKHKQWLRERGGTCSLPEVGLADVGCNAGYLTLSMAHQIGSTSMLGIDCDAEVLPGACVWRADIYVSRRLIYWSGELIYVSAQLIYVSERFQREVSPPAVWRGGIDCDAALSGAEQGVRGSEGKVVHPKPSQALQTL